MADKSSATLVIAANEQERVEKLRAAFRDQLHGWMAGVAAGVKYSPAVARALAESMFEVGLVAFIGAANQLGPETDAADAADAARMELVFAKLMAFLEAELAS